MTAVTITYDTQHQSVAVTEQSMLNVSIPDDHDHLQQDFLCKNLYKQIQ